MAAGRGLRTRPPWGPAESCRHLALSRRAARGPCRKLTRTPTPSSGTCRQDSGRGRFPRRRTPPPRAPGRVSHSLPPEAAGLGVPAPPRLPGGPSRGDPASAGPSAPAPRPSRGKPGSERAGEPQQPRQHADDLSAAPVSVPPRLHPSGAGVSGGKSRVERAERWEGRTENEQNVWRSALAGQLCSEHRAKSRGEAEASQLGGRGATCGGGGRAQPLLQTWEAPAGGAAGAHGPPEAPLLAPTVAPCSGATDAWGRPGVGLTVLLGPRPQVPGCRAPHTPGNGSVLPGRRGPHRTPL